MGELEQLAQLAALLARSNVEVKLGSLAENPSIDEGRVRSDMPKRVRIDFKTYELLISPTTGRQFLARVDDPDDAGRLLPNGMIWWHDPDRHMGQRERLESLLTQGRLEWLDATPSL